jgi:hypothetical protein
MNCSSAVDSRVGGYVREKRYQTYRFIAFQSEEQDKLETQARRPGGQLGVIVRFLQQSSQYQPSRVGPGSVHARSELHLGYISLRSRPGQK